MSLSHGVSGTDLSSDRFIFGLVFSKNGVIVSVIMTRVSCCRKRVRRTKTTAVFMHLFLAALIETAVR